jgi:hypothetical protein
MKQKLGGLGTLTSRPVTLGVSIFENFAHWDYERYTYTVFEWNTWNKTITGEGAGGGRVM